MLPHAIYDPKIPEMMVLGLTEDESNHAVDLMVKNMTWGKPKVGQREAMQVVRNFFLVMEASEAMDWIWTCFPDHRAITIYEYVLVELDIREAMLFKMRWC